VQSVLALNHTLSLRRQPRAPEDFAGSRGQKYRRRWRSASLHRLFYFHHGNAFSHYGTESSGSLFRQPAVDFIPLIKVCGPNIARAIWASFRAREQIVQDAGDSGERVALAMLFGAPRRWKVRTHRVRPLGSVTQLHFCSSAVFQRCSEREG